MNKDIVMQLYLYFYKVGGIAVSHPMPKDLKEDDRFFGINFMDLHLTKRGLIYNGGVTLFSVAILKIFENVPVFLFLLLGLNIAVYPLGQFRTKKNAFESGNLRYDDYLKKKLNYYRKKSIYLRRL